MNIVNINIAELTPGVMLVRYKSIYKIREESAALSRWLATQMANVDRVSELSKALLGNDVVSLTKAAGADLATAKADVAHLRKEHKLPDDMLKSLTKGHRIAVILKEYVARSAALEADEARSRRFNEAWSASEFDWLAPRTIH